MRRPLDMTACCNTPRGTGNRPGTVLAVTIVVVGLAAMTSVTLLFRSRAEISASSAGQKSQQAYAAAMSGLHRAISVLSDSPGNIQTWYDNPDLFYNQVVLEDGGETWYFTVYAPNPDDKTTVRYGVIDESGKININVANEQTLLGLPGMDQELVDCLLDWRDRDDEPRSAGAEQEYYSTLRPIAYRVKNSQLTTLEELMLVKGFNASVVYGEDANLNGILDANEDDTTESFPIDDGDGELNRGLMGMLTTVNYEFDVDNEGNDRININGGPEDMELLREIGLSAETVQFIELYRKEGNGFSHPAELLEMEYTLKQDHEEDPQLKKGLIIFSQVGEEQLSTVLDKLTILPTGGGRKIANPGLVNVNTAGVKVLAALPGIDENLARQIVSKRGSLDESAEGTPAWLYTEGILDAQQFLALVPRLTGRGFQFRIRCVGFAHPSGGFRVLEAVVDRASGVPIIVYIRDITRLGLPMAMDVSAEIQTVGGGG
ncbi:MAG TPA: hypothetical protein ENH84_05010 [Phycisphaerae bacterium]|nr:hypothetical protein [Phycisphaerae bacterium]